MKASFRELFSVLLWNYVFLYEQMLYSGIYHKLYNSICLCPILKSALYRENKVYQDDSYFSE